MTQRKKNNITSINNDVLSIRVSLDGLSFCIYDTSGDIIIALQNHELSGERHPETISRNLEKHFRENELLQRSFKKVFLIHENALSAFVPLSLFNEKQLPDYLKFNIKILESDFIAYDTVKNQDMVSVYIPYVNVNNVIFDHFGIFEYGHYSSVLISTLLNKTAGKKETSMFVRVQKTQFDIVVINSGKLIFYNTFTHTAKEDFIYYILFTAAQLDLDPETFPLYLLGDIAEGDAFYSILYTYVRNVFFGENYCRFPFAEDVVQPETHKELILLNSF